MIRRKMLTSEEEFEFWEKKDVRGSQNTFVGGCIAQRKMSFFFANRALSYDFFV
jgi:hypothetical protein